MRLPEDVALEVAHKLRYMICVNKIKHVMPLHVEVACKIVNANLMADSIALIRRVSNV